MSKVIKVVLSAEIMVPDNAEIIRVKDDDGVEADYIRVAGKLAAPMIHWLEYLSEARLENQIKHIKEATGVKTGMGFDQIDFDFCEDYLKMSEFPEYYLEETGEKIDDEE